MSETIHVYAQVSEYQVWKVMSAIWELNNSHRMRPIADVKQVDRAQKRLEITLAEDANSGVVLALLSALENQGRLSMQPGAPADCHSSGGSAPEVPITSTQ